MKRPPEKRILPKEPLSHRIYLRISPTHNREITELARARGIDVSVFIRMLIVNAITRARELERKEAEKREEPVGAPSHE